MTKRQKIIRLVESALMIALSTVLSEFSVIKFPFGGSVTVFSQVPVLLTAYRYGTTWGIGTGLVHGVIQMLFGLANFSYVTGFTGYAVLILADYVVAFAALGLGGAFKRIIKNPTASITCGSVLATVVRFLCHFISGVTIWRESAGDLPVWKYSLEYNGGYMLPELIITVAGVVIISMLFDITSESMRVKIKPKRVKKD